MSTLIVGATTRRAARGTRKFRTDIQALRAIAIVIVVLNHLWPVRFTGGYVGVDVFFVISGFLITSHLMAELTSTGRVRLGRFYARRIRRLLPAALLVLAASAALVFVFLPYPRWERNVSEIAAAAVYVENWALTAFSVDYSAANQASSAVQHYWSLSVEEQFYLVWPVLLLLFAGLGVRSALWRTKRALLVLGVVGVASLTASIVFTQLAPSAAYFITPTRMWEFVFGGLVAVAGARLRLPRRLADPLAVLGFAGIIVAVFLYGPDTPFPGTAALLPVLTTTAVIVAGNGHERLLHGVVTGSPPVQWLGNISYSLYLWHWPLIVVAPFAMLAPLSTLSKAGVFALALLLAWLTYRFVERPGQTWRVLSQSTARSVIAMVVGMAIVLGAAAALQGAYAERSRYDRVDGPVPAGSCVGPDAIEAIESCPDAFGPAESTVITAAHEYFWTPDTCQLQETLVFGDRRTTTVCDFRRDDRESADVWLVGDSHAQQWQGPLLDIAAERGWRLTLSYFGGCPVADVPFTGYRNTWTPPDVEACRSWSRAVSDAVADAHPKYVFTSMAARRELIEGDQDPGRVVDRFAAGLLADWNKWADAGSQVLPLADPPLNGEIRSPDCVLLNPANPLECARPRAEADPPDPLVVAGERADRPEIALIDLTDAFCDDSSCYAVIGGEPVYYDADHLSRRYSRMLSDRIEAVMDRLPAA